MSLKKEVIRGIGWATCMRWTIRFMGLASSAILARLLMPEDFGLVAIALVLIGLTKIFFEFGVELALIRDSKADEADFNTAWTIRLLQAVAVSAVIFLLAPIGADFYGDDRLINVFYISAVSILLQSFENIGIVSFRKNLEFSKDFQFYVLNKFLGTLLTVALAFYFRSYYALIIGSAVNSLISTILSYIFSSFRPRVSLSRWGKLWSFF